VAAGPVLAAELSSRRGWIAPEEVAGLRRLLTDAHLPVEPPADITSAQFLDLMARDKKALDGRLRLVLLSAIGDACVVDDASAAEIEALIG
jgi:3-dehydroquinate synthase